MLILAHGGLPYVIFGWLWLGMGTGLAIAGCVAAIRKKKELGLGLSLGGLLWGISAIHTRLSWPAIGIAAAGLLLAAGQIWISKKNTKE
ncbi:hypothetical protein [Rariglobus hedericola]|uniref:Uncharacterized protein n=1 Tax=Rariglobus hedericola TaxID=2597822 RepID=A0A556QEU2_9BACT|nr:hypothetical protein [Rariglobus hedericola]TSJ75137.1 hypothetical protein FPL22_17215 [Rariglobus hedericola]